MEMIGTVLEGKYEIIRLIGEGGMGAVYEAHHRLIGRKVAVKFLHAEFATNPQAIQRFLQEAQIAGSLGHANICEVTDIGRLDDGSPYMLMPFLDGRSLGEEMNAHEGLLPTSRVFDIIYQVLTALQRAHDEGIVHRDLKPDNIFITHMGDREDFVKILDFGISKIVSGSTPGVSGGLTTTGMVLGTPYYMAPEQARGAKDIDHRVDIYAIGVILYELLTGQPPFEAESYNEIIVKIVTEPFPTPRTLNASIPPSVENVVLKAMARDPNERYSSARGFKRALLARARDSQMKLPGYLTQVDFTGEIPLIEEPTDPGSPRPSTSGPSTSGPHTTFDETELAFKRRRWAKPAIVGLLLAAVAVVLLVWQPWKDGSKASKKQDSTPAPSAATKPEPTTPQKVTLRFQGIPKGGTVTVNGRPAPLGEITLDQSTKRVQYRATAPGHKPQQGWIVPDQNRTKQLQLDKLVAAKTGRKPMRTGRRRRRGSKAGMKAMSTGSKAGMKTVMGRGGTEIDDDYDQD